ncbi:MAG TPA: serine hydrolase domain-containing protein [Gemmatimonadota bacterium]|nr:serine hydrolase domain-containing protein [Gemmatimonadota bacterium]
MRRDYRFRWLLLLGALLACTDTTRPDPPLDTVELARQLETLRRTHGIPGMAAAIGCEGSVRWSSGFGSADVARGVPATPETVFHVASLTKTFASVVLLQLADEGRIGLDDPVSDYGVELPGDVRVRHLMSHTSDPPAGAAFRYDGNRYALLDSVVRRADGQPFTGAVLQRVIAPAGLTRTAPASLAGDGIDAVAIGAALAQGYDGRGFPIAYPTHVNVAAGLLSTVLDLVAYGAAIEQGRLYPDGGRALAFTPMRATSGAELPYGLGWFVEHRTGGDVAWHFGSWTGNSALLVLAPDRGASFALLANSDRLSTPFPLEEGRLESSAFARAFLGWLEQGEGCG